MRKILPFLIIIFTIGIVITPLNLFATEGEFTVDISTLPSAGFINFERIVPGDSSASKITIANSGTLDFNYRISSILESGSNLLFNQLFLEVLDEQGNLIYSGNLGGLKEYWVGTIPSGGTQNLLFKIHLPLASGNEFQSLSTKVAFNFYAEQHESEIPSGESGTALFEHPVINNNFIFKIPSTVPFKFHLLDIDGRLELTPRSNITFEISNLNSEGQEVIRQFKLSDGTLNFDSELDFGHYIANVDSKDIPLESGLTYKATVKDGSTVLGSMEFLANSKPGTSRSNAPE